jgi:beta-glucanase (GH16 family)
MAICSAILTVACSRHTAIHKGTLEWQEEFNQTNAFDEKTWTKIPRGTSDWDKYMSDYDSLYAMRDGKLVLRGINNTTRHSDTARYITGGLYTKDKVTFGFGRLEIRAKLNGARGAWPAIWMLSQNNQWPDGGEIDIMERLNADSIAYQTTHTYYTHHLNIKNNPKQGSTGPINPTAFNTYAVEKYRDSLVYYINDKRTYAYPRIQTDKKGQFPFDQHKYYLLIDMQLGGSWVGAVNPDDLPVEMEVDWVRFYKFNDQEK